MHVGIEGGDVELVGPLRPLGRRLEQGVVVPVNETHIHYGLGQIKAEINLEPGRHTLTLQFADGVHVSYGEEMSAIIEIEIVNQ